MEKDEKFLPIGTVVLLEGGKKELMIMSYCIKPTGEVYDKDGIIDAKDKVFDYGGCLYPEGMITSNQLFAFNHDQIARVCFKGYKTEVQQEISNELNKINIKVENQDNNQETTKVNFNDKQIEFL